MPVTSLRVLCIVTVVLLSIIHPSLQLPRRSYVSRRAIDGSRGRKYFHPDDGDDSYGSAGGQYDPYEERTDLSDIRTNVPGEPGVDYPAYTTLPQTAFSCGGRYRGYYADESTGCQVFHVCHDDVLLSSFLCPVGSTFSQKLLTCDWWNKVDCSSTRNYVEVEHNSYNLEDDDEMIRKAYAMMNLQTGNDDLIDPDQRNVFIGNDLPEDYSNTNYDDYGILQRPREKPLLKSDHHPRIPPKYQDSPIIHIRRLEGDPPLSSQNNNENRFQPSYAPTVPTVTTTTRKLYSPTVPTTYKSSTLAYHKLDQVNEGSHHLFSNRNDVFTTTEPSFYDKSRDKEIYHSGDQGEGSSNYEDYANQKEAGFSDRSADDTAYTDELIEMRESIGLGRALNKKHPLRTQNSETDYKTTTPDYENEQHSSTFGARTTPLLRNSLIRNNTHATQSTTPATTPTFATEPTLINDDYDTTNNNDNNRYDVTEQPWIQETPSIEFLPPPLFIDYDNLPQNETVEEDFVTSTPQISTTLPPSEDLALSNFVTRFLSSTVGNSYVRPNVNTRPDVVRTTLEQVDKIIQQANFSTEGKNETPLSTTELDIVKSNSFELNVNPPKASNRTEGIDAIDPFMINEQINKEYSSETQNDNNRFDSSYRSSVNLLDLMARLLELDRVPRPFSRSIELRTKSDYGSLNLNDPETPPAPEITQISPNEHHQNNQPHINPNLENQSQNDTGSPIEELSSELSPPPSFPYNSTFFEAPPQKDFADPNTPGLNKQTLLETLTLSLGAPLYTGDDRIRNYPIFELPTPERFVDFETGEFIGNRSELTQPVAPTTTTTPTKTTTSRAITTAPKSMGLIIGQKDDSINEEAKRSPSIQATTPKIVSNTESSTTVKTVVETEFLPSIGFSFDTDEGRREYVEAVFEGIIDQSIHTGRNYFPNQEVSNVKITESTSTSSISN